MESPVFKLEKVVHSRAEELQDFEGPLDLILFLLGKNKMEIQDISISLICDQYLVWLDQRQRLDLEVASEFAAMASHLVYLKTRMLLSIEDEEAKSEMEALMRSLEERRRGESYAYVKAMAEALAPLGEFGRDILTRGPEPLDPGQIRYDHSRRDLLKAMRGLQGRAERKLPPSKAAFQEIAQHEPYPVERKALDILRRLREGGGAARSGRGWARRPASSSPSIPRDPWRSACAACGRRASPASSSSSAGAGAAARWWRPSWRCWSCAGPTCCN